MELKEYQQRAVDRIVAEVKRDLGDNITQRIYLEAPTGAGKTVIASAAMEQISQTLPFDYDCRTPRVAFIWIAPNKLHEQSYLKMKSFFQISNSMRPMVWDELDHSLGHLEHGDVLFLNWPSITRDDNLILRDTEQRRGLIAVVRETQLVEHTPIVVIIDEEHLYSGKNANKATAILSQINPDVELRISATPNYPQGGGFTPIVIDRRDVVQEEMIKKNVVINPGVNTRTATTQGLTPNEYLLRLALLKRKELAGRYAKIGSPVNPLLLIQLPNDNKSLNADDNHIIDEVKTFLAHPEVDITEQNGKLGIWLSGEKQNLDDIAKADSLTEVLIFKEAISKGWDCPRAAVLLIFRDMKSYAFTLQTVGRIMRMPQQKFYTDDALNHGYVYTNLANSYIDIQASAADYLNKDVAVRRSNVMPLTVPTQVVVTHKVQNTLGYLFRKYLKKSFEDLWHLKELDLQFDYGGHDLAPMSADSLDQPAPTTAPVQLSFDNSIIENRRRIANQGIDLDVRHIYTVVPKDMTIDLTGVGTYQVGAGHKAQLARTQGEIDRLFTNFCMASIIKFDKRDSTKAMEHALLQFMEDYAQILSTDAKKIILYYKNRPKFLKVMRHAQERYAVGLAKRQKQQSRILKPATWQLPEERGYDGATHHTVNAPGHALQQFYELNFASIPEQQFRLFLEQNSASIEWWYKNGDKGAENFSVPYTNNQGVQANFYVDFIIRLRNGRILLFDTKSSTGDPEAVNKHNALLQWISDYNKEHLTHWVGGIIIMDHGQWLYSRMPIENTADHEGWTPLDIEKLNQQH